MLAVLDCHSHNGALRTQHWAFQIIQSKLCLPLVNVDISSRGNREWDRGVGGVLEKGKLEGDVFLELHADGISFLQQCC